MTLILHSHQKSVGRKTSKYLNLLPVVAKYAPSVLNVARVKAAFGGHVCTRLSSSAAFVL